MRSSYFFVDVPNSDDPWDMNGDPWSTRPSTSKLDLELVRLLRRGPLEVTPDHEAALGILDLAYEELEAFGTNGEVRLEDSELEEVLRALEQVTQRLGVPMKIPFRDFTRFRSYWIKHDCSGSYQRRRDLLEAMFEPVRAKLIRLDEIAGVPLATAVSPRSSTGWAKVDSEISELRRRFLSSSSPQDYRAIGTHCVGVLEALSRIVYDPTKHLRPGEQVPPVDKSKMRIERYIEDALPGNSNDHLRGLARKVIEVAHEVKHSETPTRTEAGIASDATILLANMLRRLDDGLS